MTEKTYLENPYLRDFKGKIIKKEKVDDMYHIILNRTIFNPNSFNGKPKDEGTINGVELVDVFEKNGDIIHVVKENISSKDVTMSINWNIRFDYMQHHTGQHILSASIHKLYHKDTINFELDEDCAYIDINIPQLNTEDINRIEKFSNSIVHSNFKIKTYKSSKEEEQFGIKLGTRIVDIDNIDIMPCKGIHCSNSGEVGIIKIKSWEKIEDNNIRVQFLCGNRALKDYEAKIELINNISKLLSLKDLNVYEGVESLIGKNKKLEEKIRDLKEELNIYNQK